MTTVEPKIAERRQRVTEDRARRRLRSAMLILALIALGAVVWWLLRSPLLSVRTVEVEGAQRSNPGAIAAGVGVVPGLPTMSVDEAALRRALLDDPWIDDADVAVRWPGTVAVAVVEHVPVAVADDGGGAMLLSADGTVLAPADGEPATIGGELSLLPPGGVVSDPALRGALAFLAELPADLRREASLTVSSGSIDALVAGHPVRLGAPVDMEQKARTLAALLENGIDDGLAVDLLAPLHPAVADVQPEVEGEEDDPSEGEASG